MGNSGKMREALILFSESDEFVGAVVSSTMAGWGGSRYCVEVFPDGRHRVLAEKQFGNLYHSPGVIVPIPALTESQVDEASGETMHDVVEFYRCELAERLIDLFDGED